jgi:hypothetical protein
MKWNGGGRYLAFPIVQGNPFLSHPIRYSARMKFSRRDPWPAAPEFEHLARFGDAEIVKDLRGRLHLRGGTPEDQAAARAWADRFLSVPLHAERPRSYSILSPPNQPSAINHQPFPLPPPRPELTPEERWRHYLTNNPPLEPRHPRPGSPAEPEFLLSTIYFLLLPSAF